MKNKNFFIILLFFIFLFAIPIKASYQAGFFLFKQKKVLAQDDMKTTDEIFNYAPGEIIIKYKNETTNINKKLINEMNVLKESGIKETGQRKYLNKKTIDKIGVNKIKILDNNNLKVNIEKFKNIIKKAKENKKSLLGGFFNNDNNKIKINDDKFGELNINLNNKNQIDPYTQELLDELNNNPNIEYAEPNYIVKMFAVNPGTDEYYSLMWGLENTSQQIPLPGGSTDNGLSDADIDAEEGWLSDNSNGGGDTIVAVIDSGVDYTHEDLGSCTLEEVNDGVASTCPKFVPGYDFHNNDNDPMDDHGHGTHCAGTIAASNNTTGITGISPNTKIMPIKGLDSDGSGYVINMAQAIIWAVDNGADVLNNSWGGEVDSQTLRDAFAYAYENGVVSIAAAGNDGVDAKDYYPASYNNIITVGATNHYDLLASFSNFGSNIDVVAPGVYVLSLRASETDYYGDGTHIYEENYYISNGTSMATPHVSGVAALIKANYPTLNPDEIELAIRGGADDLGTSGFDETYGYGRLNLANSLNFASLLTDNVIDIDILNPDNNSNIEISTNTAYTLIYKNGTLDSQAYYYMKDETGQLSPIAEICSNIINSTDISGATTTYNFSCDLNVTTLHGDYFLIVNATNTDSVQFTKHVKINTNNLYFSNLADNDIRRLGDALTIRGKTFSHNFSIEWSESGADTWSTADVSTSSQASLPLGVETELATWDTGTANFSQGEYDIKIKIGSEEYLVENIFLESYFKSGWPKYFNYDYNTNHLTHLIEDVTGNTNKEIITIKYGDPPELLIFNSAGTLLNSIRIDGEALNSNIPPLLSGDMDGDGQNEIIVIATQENEMIYNTRVHAFKSDGAEATNFPLSLPVAYKYQGVVADLDHDGIDELVLQSTRQDLKKYLLIYKNGELFNKINVKQHASASANSSLLYNNNPAIANLDDDSDLEIIIYGPTFINDEYIIQALNIDGTNVSGWPKTLEYYLSGSIITGDVNNDNKEEIIFGSEDYFWILDRYGAPLSGWPVAMNHENKSTPALADINNDGYLEIAFSAGDLMNGQQFYIYNYQGNLLSGWPQSHALPTSEYVPLFADVNNDNQMDLITSDYYYINIFNASGTQIYELRLESESNSISVNDIENDGTIDLIALSRYGYYGTGEELLSRASIQIYELSSGNATTSLAWGKFNKDNQNSGRYSTETNLGRPMSLAANGSNPSSWTYDYNFEINWENSILDYPLIHYKLGSVPDSNSDGIATTSKPFYINATTSGETLLHVWLENSSGQTNYLNYSSVSLRIATTGTAIATTTGLTASPGNASIMLSWDANNDMGSEIDGYDIYYLHSCNFQSISKINPSLVTNTTYTIDGLNNGTKYCYAIKGVSEQNAHQWMGFTYNIESGFSNIVFATPYAGPYYHLGPEIKISSGQFKEQYMPRIDDNKIVWSDYRNGNFDIFLYNIASNTESAITTNSSKQSNPDIKNNLVIWSDDRDGYQEIYTYNLNTDQESALDKNLSPKYEPHLTDNYIVWRNIIGSRQEIFYNNITTNTTVEFTSGHESPNLPFFPMIYSENIFWQTPDDIEYKNINDENSQLIEININNLRLGGVYDDKVTWVDSESGNKDIWLYDHSEDEKSQITLNLDNQDFSDIHNNKIVWQDFRNNSYDIYMYDISTGNEYRISTSSASEVTPAVYNNYVVWQDSRDGGSSIYMREVFTEPLAPSGLTATDLGSNQYSIDWIDSFDPSGIKGYWYKIGAAPTSDEDGTYTTAKPINASINSTQTIYLWLENNDNHKNYNNSTSTTVTITVNEESTPVSSGGGGGGGSYYAPKIKNNNISDDLIKISTSTKTLNGQIISFIAKLNCSFNANDVIAKEVVINTSDITETDDISIKLNEKFLSDINNNYGTSTFKINIEAKKASKAQKSAIIGSGKYLVGFDIFSIDFVIGTTSLKNFNEPIVIIFDVDYNDLEKNIKAYYYNENTNTWEIAGDGGIIIFGKLLLSINHLTDFGIIYDNLINTFEEKINNNKLNDRDIQLLIIKNDAEMVYNSGANLNDIIIYNNTIADPAAQELAMYKYTNKIINNSTNLSSSSIYSINNFILYGTKSTQILGAGERAGVVNSYNAAFNKLPQTKEEWQDVIKIANGRWPGETSQNATNKAKTEFEKVFLREANMDNQNDNAAITIMAYGLRPIDRNLDSEKAGIIIFKNIYNHNPSSATDWDVVRAISYSGATR